MDNDVEYWYNEVMDCLTSIDLNAVGEHLHSNYQDIIAMVVRLQQIHNEISWDEVQGTASSEKKKFRTMILDSTLERLEKVASYESRKLTALQMERELEK